MIPLDWMMTMSMMTLTLKHVDELKPNSIAEIESLHVVALSKSLLLSSIPVRPTRVQANMQRTSLSSRYLRVVDDTTILILLTLWTAVKP